MHGTGRARAQLTYKARKFATGLQQSICGLHPAHNKAHQVCTQHTLSATSMQTVKPAMQDRCNSAILGCKIGASLWCRNARSVHICSTVVCYRLAQCVYSVQTVELLLQTQRILAILCNDLTSVCIQHTHTPTKFASGLHMHPQNATYFAFGSRQACIQHTYTPHQVPTVMLTTCKINGSWQHFAYGLHNFTSNLQQSVCSSHLACIRSHQLHPRLAYALFGFAFSSPLAGPPVTANASHMQAYVAKVCCRLA